MRFHRLSSPLLITLTSLAGFASAQSQVQELEGSTLPPDSHFGRAVAATPQLVAIGMAGPTFQTATPGAVHVLRRDGLMHWRQARLTAPDGIQGDKFGWAVDLEGTTLVVGAHEHDLSRGAVYVFELADRTWGFTQKLVAPDGAPADHFGEALGLQGDGLAVGARGHDAGAPGAGAVYVFRRMGGTWSFEAKLLANDPEPYDLLGLSVDIHGDRVVAGAVQDSDAAKWSGAVYVWRRVIDTLWTQEAKLIPADASGSDFFGTAVELVGPVLVASSPYHNGLGGSNQGTVYLFLRDENGWQELQQITAPAAPAWSFFGLDLALEGTRLCIGSGIGRAYLFEWDGAQYRGGVRLEAAPDGTGNTLGEIVDIADGLVFVGSPNASHTGVANGSAYVFDVGP